jgi:hypothetical protein
MSTAVEVLKRFISEPEIEVNCPFDGYVIMSVKADGADLMIRFIGGQRLDDSPTVRVDLFERDAGKTWSMSLVGNWLEETRYRQESSDSADNSAAFADSPQSIAAE